MRAFVTRAIPLFLAAAISVPASPQIRTAPQPVVRNPNAPQRDVQRPPVRFTNLAFTIWTGDDDLRANSTLGADLHFGTAQRFIATSALETIHWTTIRSIAALSARCRRQRHLRSSRARKSI